MILARRIWNRQFVLGKVNFSTTSLRLQKQINLGGLKYEINQTSNKALVPQGFFRHNEKQGVLPLVSLVLSHLKWMMQKDILGQDMFLLGPPGSLKRQIAMAYCELTEREVEYVCLSRDVTESDLKQRREIRSNSAVYIDQVAVKAAKNGRVLVLDGIEKAERNVLPILNNLLENREMRLEDGNFLVNPSRYDSLLKEHSKEEMDEAKLIRVHENFRVIALGLPVPQFPGNALDPPLRSRFQCRDLGHMTYDEQVTFLKESCEMDNSLDDFVKGMASVATTLYISGTEAKHPKLSLDANEAFLKVHSKFGNHLNIQNIIKLIFPFHLRASHDSSVMIEHLVKRFLPEKKIKNDLKILSIDHKKQDKANIVLASSSGECSFSVAAGGNVWSENAMLPFYESKTLGFQLSTMMALHNIGDFCIVGQKGVGKTALVSEFAKRLKYNVETMFMYADMSARDLLQQRETLKNGDTSWRPSPLVTAAQTGSFLVLDGIHHVDSGTFRLLQRLMKDRELSLFDGSRMVARTKYDLIMKEGQLTESDMRESNIFPIHPSFRIVCLAEPPKMGAAKSWLNDEALSMCLFIDLQKPKREDEFFIIKTVIPEASDTIINKVLALAEALRVATDHTILSLANALTTRQLIRVCKRVSSYEESLYNVIHEISLSKFLSPLAREALDKMLAENGIVAPENEVDYNIQYIEKDGKRHIKIGNVSHEISENTAAENVLVPEVLFYDNKQHTKIIADLLKDFSLGEHLLMIGNQGVGKNKVVDRFLNLLNRPREYMQLHRDTTIQQLTITPSVRDGVIYYDDSALVLAAKYGRVLVIDEADKAPTNVTGILKSLAECGTMRLSDGRQIIPIGSKIENPDYQITMHPSFRIIVLANRPGFPFLGNDFFASLGDVFSCHAIDNPDLESEISMLKNYGPSIPDSVLYRLAAVFNDLRNFVHEGKLNYPYSTRELVNIVKHLEAFPDEGIVSTIRNVFDFDSYDTDSKNLLVKTLSKHGIPLHGKTTVTLSPSTKLDSPIVSNTLTFGKAEIISQSKIQKFSWQGPWLLGSGSKFDVDRVDVRDTQFSEEKTRIKLPIDYSAKIVGTTQSNTSEHSMHVLTENPLALLSFSQDINSYTYVDMENIKPWSRRRQSEESFWSLNPLTGRFKDNLLLHNGIDNTIIMINVIKQSAKVTKLKIVKDSNKNTSDTWGGMFGLQNENNSEGSSTLLPFNENANVFVLIKKKEVYLLDLNDCTIKNTNINNVSSAVFLKEQNLLFSCLGTPFLFSSSRGGSFLLQEINAENTLNFEPCLRGNELLEKGDGEFPLVTTHAYANILTNLLESNTNAENKTCTVLSYYRSDSSPSDGQSTLSDEHLTPSDGHSTPLQSVYIKDSKTIANLNSGRLELIDLVNENLSVVTLLNNDKKNDSQKIYLESLRDGSLVIAEEYGEIRIFDTCSQRIGEALSAWTYMSGSGASAVPPQLTIERKSGLENSGPKHGKIDKDNKPHVGGNQWAGGTGGRDTAGLGGKGGPYRLDAGHDVHQLSKEEKDAVPDDVKKAAREMGEQAFRERLKEIQMSEYDAQVYQQYFSAVSGEVKELRNLVSTLEFKSTERTWLKNQNVGDLDDSRLVDGVSGETNIYKRRGEEKPDFPSNQAEKPKRIRFVVDVSGSMYRFNGFDGRLTRMCECVCMIMESFDNNSTSLKYEIYGHSGDGAEIVFVTENDTPKNEKERLRVLENMVAHSQYCMSGDNTLEATSLAIKNIVEKDADEHMVVVVSDANLDIYNISPRTLRNILVQEEKVQAVSIFLGSLGDQADRLVKGLGPGRGFVCMVTKDLPKIMKQLFTSTMLK